MPFPSPSRLESFLKPYACKHDIAVRVWGVDAGAAVPAPETFESLLFGHPPRLVLLGGSEDGLAMVRQTHDGLEDLDGTLVPWESVVRLERDPHLVRDMLRIELAGQRPVFVAVSNHVLLPANRASAKALCDLARNPKVPVAMTSHLPLRIEPHPA